MSLKRYSFLLACAGLLAGGAAAADEPCGAAVQTARAEWQSLSGGRLVAPAQQVLTADGRRLTGSAINYGHALISQADSACLAGRGDAAMASLREVQGIFHPVPQRM
jgi:hypothetical protein